MRVALALLALFGMGCGGERADEMTVEVIRVAPRQLLDDSLELTPVLDTTQNAPEQGQVALSIEVHVKNAAGTSKHVPAIGFRAVPESGRDTAAPWRYDITRRTVDSLRPGESATFGLTTSPRSLAAARVAGGVYRVEAVLGDSTTNRRAVPVGRIRLRQPGDST